MHKADNLLPSCAVVTKSGNLNFLEPSGPLQACNGTALPFFILRHTGHRTQHSVVTLKCVTIKCSDCKSRYSNLIFMLFAQIVSAHNNFICRALQCGNLWVKALHLLHTQVLTQSDLHELYSDLASNADSQTIHISEVIHQLYIMFIRDCFHILTITLPMGFVENE